MSSHYYPKLAYNVKIRGKKQLFGRKQFRIRSDIRDPSMMRSKLYCDVSNRLGFVNSTSTNYVKVIVNNEDLGFYIIIEYNDPDTTDLIQCKYIFAFLDYNSTYTNCVNENEDNPDMTNFGVLLNTLDNANSIREINEIFDVENFLKNMILEWLTASWDHLTLMGHNYNVYKIPDGKWTYSVYDYDTTFGGELGLGLFFRVPEPLYYDDPDTWFKVKFENWINNNQHIMQVIMNDKNNPFLEYLQEIINNAFNPVLLFKRIDEIKEFISPYVKEDRTPDKNGKLPGRLNEASINYDYSYKHFEGVTEFSTIQTHFNGLYGYSYGLKKWILDKFVFVCENYDIDCSVGQEYLDSYKFNSFRDAYEITTGDVEELESTKSISTDTEITTTTTATATTTSETSDNKTINDDNLNDENKDESNSANQIHINSLLIILLMNVVVFML
ncbi:coth protein-domain-containing protein [Neocallimastix sp. 'constans']